MSDHDAKKKPHTMPVLQITEKEAAAFADTTADANDAKQRERASAHKIAVAEIKARALKLGPIVTVQTETGRIVTTLRS